MKPRHQAGRVVVATVLVLCAFAVATSTQEVRLPDCADVNSDRTVDLSDPVWLLNWLFLDGPTPGCAGGTTHCGDANGDLRVDVSDPVAILNFLFLSGAAPECDGGLVFAGFTRLKDNRQGLAEYRHDATGIVFVLVPGGDGHQGAQSDDPSAPNHDPDAGWNLWWDPRTGEIRPGHRPEVEGPVHPVTLGPFLIAKYEVTQAEWTRVMDSNPSCFQGVMAPPGVDTTRLPVEQVSWNDVQEFERRSGLTLPTEAQWEFACRAFEGGPFSPAGNPDAVGWHLETAGEVTHEVGTKMSNAFGLHDMHGNVEEWCEDRYDARFYDRPEASGRDPVSRWGLDRVVRGGSWGVSHLLCRSAVRAGYPPSYGARFSSWLGFRPARPLDPRVELDATALEFGLVPIGRGRSARLVVRNVGARVLELTDLSFAGADAEAFVLVDAARSIAIHPGEQRALEVRLTEGAAGVYDAELFARTNDEQRPTLSIRLRGEGLQPPAGLELDGLTALGANQNGFFEYRHEASGIVLVHLPGGVYRMGAQFLDPDAPNFDPSLYWTFTGQSEGPVHEVELRPFLIGKHEVTQEEWTRVMGVNFAFYQGDHAPAGVDAARLPIESVSWADVQTFQRRSGLVLPSEAQWEFACRAGYGIPRAAASEPADVAWYEFNSDGVPHVVGTRAANPFGIHDLHGNVAEWCADALDPEFYARLEARGPDPVATSDSEERVFRGGSFASDDHALRSSWRSAAHRDAATRDRGFRVALAVP